MVKSSVVVINEWTLGVQKYVGYNDIKGLEVILELRWYRDQSSLDIISKDFFLGDEII